MEYTTIYCRSRRCSLYGKTGMLAHMKLHGVYRKSVGEKYRDQQAACQAS